MDKLTRSSIILLFFLINYLFAQNPWDKFLGTYVSTTSHFGYPCNDKDTLYVVKEFYTHIPHSPQRLRFIYGSLQNTEGVIVEFSDSSISNDFCNLLNHSFDKKTGYFFKYDDRGYFSFWERDSHLHVSPDTLIYYHPNENYDYRFARIAYTTPYDTLISISPLAYRSLKIYPQPAQNEIFVSDLPQGKKSLSLLDLLGKVVWHKESWLESEKIDLTDLPKGMYILEVQTEGKRFTEKVLKE